METIINKVAESGLITLDLETFMPAAPEVLVFDIKPFLFKELLLREKDFRASLQVFDFSIFQDKYAAVYCSADAIIPMWAYMLIMTYLDGKTKKTVFGTKEQAIIDIAIDNIKDMDVSKYIDARIVVKGCGDRGASAGMYLMASQILLPHVKTLMFGEPCSTVPIYKKKKTTTI